MIPKAPYFQSKPQEIQNTKAKEIIYKTIKYAIWEYGMDE